MTKKALAEQAEWTGRLRVLIAPGQTIYTSITHVARSGMSRHVRVYTVVDGEISDVTGLVAGACGYRRSQGSHWDIVVGGCGFDAGFQVVHDLSYRLHPDGFDCTGDRCPSNDHSNGDRDHTPHRHAGHGYSLRHATL